MPVNVCYDLGVCILGPVDVFPQKAGNMMVFACNYGRMRFEDMRCICIIFYVNIESVSSHVGLMYHKILVAFSPPMGLEG